MELLTRPFGKIVNMSDNSVFLDTIYIPTLCNRGKPATSLTKLLKYTKEIVLLFSKDIPVWSNGLDSRIHIKRMMDYPVFCKQYNTKNENINPSIKWRPKFDIPLKRSYALFDARNKNKKNIMLLDDDIYLSKSNMITGISALGNNMSIIGFHVAEYPDISTIDHFERMIMKNPKPISMTGSCMFINVDLVRGDFANIYNEDLFFFFKQPDNNSVVSGGTIIQKPYNPFTSTQRIKHEQFGDIIYEAIKDRIIGNELSAINWQNEINKRISRIEEIKTKINPEYIELLDVAIESISDIDTVDIEYFLDNYNFADWVTKYYT